MTEKLKPVEKLSYEQAMAEMEEIIRKMENDQLVLEDALALFERGQALAKHCADLLSKAELKVRQLTGREMDALQEEE
jgi:exodeoxyribonuclease VII small subunit